MRFQAGTSGVAAAVRLRFGRERGDDCGGLYLGRTGYEIIANANEVIQYRPVRVRAFPAAGRKSVRNYLAQAYFLRALVHLDLCLALWPDSAIRTADDASHLGTAVMTTIFLT